MDGTVRVYLAADRSLLHNLEVASTEVEWMSWHPSGPIILIGGADASVTMWHAVSGSMMQAFTGHGGSVLAGGFTADGKVICTGGEDNSVKVWNPKTGLPIHNLKNLHSSPITTIAFHPSQRLLMSCDAEGNTKVINVDSGKVVLTMGGHTDGIEAAGFSAT
jgi:WD40 repeat protein